MKVLLLVLILLSGWEKAIASNDLTSNPLVLDTAGATTITTLTYRVSAIVWDCGTSCAAGDTVLLKNSNSNVVFAMTASTTNFTGGMTFGSSVGFPVQGLILSTMTHGKVYIYYEH